MPRPQPQPLLRKAPRKEHPYAPAAVPPAPEPDAPRIAAAPDPAATDESKKKVDEKVFSTRLDRALIRRVKARALEDDVSVQVLVAIALTEYLDRNQD
jgi:hypothetical protein